MGAGIAATTPISPVALGLLAGIAVALIFFLRMRIEAMAGKVEVTQSFAAGFETEHVLYLLPLATLFSVEGPFLIVASIGAPLSALWVLFDYRKVGLAETTR